jgi:hypothetical protein
MMVCAGGLQQKFLFLPFSRTSYLIFLQRIDLSDDSSRASKGHGRKAGFPINVYVESVGHEFHLRLWSIVRRESSVMNGFPS